MTIRGGVEDTRHEAKAKDTKKSEAKDSPSEERRSQGQGQECSRPRPRTQKQVFSKKKGHPKIFSGDLQKKGLQNFFSGNLQKKNGLEKIFSADLQNFKNSKHSAVLEPKKENFRGLEASRPLPRTSKCVLEAKDVFEGSTSGEDY